MKQSIKIDNYDNFFCTANQCDFTCCKGWDIVIDDATVNQWTAHEKIDHTTYMIKSEGEKQGYRLNMGTEKSCPFLNEHQLCSLVLNGEAALQPHTCDIYPRQINEVNDILEYSLSFGCPAVVDQMKERTTALQFICEGVSEEHGCNENEFNHCQCESEKPHVNHCQCEDKKPHVNHFQCECENPHINHCQCEGEKDKVSYRDDKQDTRDKVLDYTPQSELEIRDTMIYLFQKEGMSLEDKFTVTAYMLHDLLEDMNDSMDILKLYHNEEYLKMVLEGIAQIDMNYADRLLEKNEIFLDITQYYRKEEYYKSYLEGLTEYAEYLQEDLEEDELIPAMEECFRQFELKMKPYELLLQNVFVSKIFACCVSDDIETILESFQLLLVEYVMIRHAAFLTVLQGDEDAMEAENLYQMVRDSIIRFSRMIEYNLEGMREFFAGCFDDVIWDLGYLLLLLK